MKNTITIKGKLVFNHKPLTKKHKVESNTKYNIMLSIKDDSCAYYAWFFKKKGLDLILPISGAHITIVNDYINRIDSSAWESLYNSLHGELFEITLSLKPLTNGKHWWFKTTESSAENLQEIRNFLGLGKSQFPYHLTIGYTNERNIEHSKYLQDVFMFHNNYKF